MSLLLPLPGGVREAYWRWASPRALLIVRPGSIDLGLFWGTALRAKFWAIGVYARLGPGATASKREFVDNLRSSIIWGRQLPRLDELTPDKTAELAAKQLLVVLVHGLFGTDRGTFDNVIKRLEERGPWPIYQALRAAAENPNTPEEQLGQLEAVLPALQEQLRPLLDNDDAMEVLCAERRPFVEQRRELVRCAISFVGFPHFTLDTVSSNGELLYDLLAKKFGPGGRSWRSCATHAGAWSHVGRLRRPGARMWVPIEDIITFGTPHDGAELAEFIGNDVDFASYILALQAGPRQTTASLLQVMSYLQANKAAGILDLRPGGGVRRGEEQEPFIDRLYTTERASGRPFLTAVGGELETDGHRSLYQTSALIPSRFRNDR